LTRRKTDRLLRLSDERRKRDDRGANRAAQKLTPRR
jgi:hypothetical protein